MLLFADAEECANASRDNREMRKVYVPWGLP